MHHQHAKPTQTFRHLLTVTAAFLRANRFFAASILLLVISVGCLAAALIVQNRTPHIAKPGAMYDSHREVVAGDADIRLASVRFTDGSGHFAAPPGQHYAIIDFTVRNITNRNFDVLPSSDTYAKDQVGTVSYLTPYSLEHPFRAGALPAGESVHGELSFLVAKTGTVHLYIDAIWSGGVIGYTLQQSVSK